MNITSNKTLVQKSYLDTLNFKINISKSWICIMEHVLQKIDSGHTSPLMQWITFHVEPTEQSRKFHWSIAHIMYIQQKFYIENYVKQLPLSKRLNFTKLRISSHMLAIETGRYTRPITPIISILCVLYNTGAIEDELHIGLKCSFFNQQREALQNNILTF